MEAGEKEDDLGADEEDDEEDVAEGEELLSLASIAQLRAALERMKTGPAAAQLVAAVRSMKKSQKAALAEFGLV